MKVIQFIKHGLLSLADPYVEPRAYIYPTNGGFQRDHDRLVGDIKAVGGQLRKTIDKHGRKQPHELTSIQ